tara:strand:- start:2953 stop:3615 length:663 start_codon:yes stop_codon:yes gene_type:complete
MKTLIQLFLFSTIIILGFFFYKNYFAINKNENELAILNEKFENLDKAEKSVTDNIDKKEKINKEIKSKIPEKTQKANSSIQNLSYKVKLPDDKEYEIIANSSELSYKNNSEIIFMNNVVARFIDDDNKIIKIEADEAFFNNSNYNTNFNKNVKIEYLNNLITSDKLNYNFEKSEILIRENIIYKGVHGTIIADNILINILSKNIDVFMDNSTDKIKIESY